jgi:hypothetical protein
MVYSGLCTLQARIVYISIRGANVAAIAAAVNGNAIINLRSYTINLFDAGKYTIKLTTMEKAVSTKGDWPEQRVRPPQYHH